MNTESADILADTLHKLRNKLDNLPDQVVGIAEYGYAVTIYKDELLSLIDSALHEAEMEK